MAGRALKIASPRPSWWTSDEWETPPGIFAEIAAVYGPFDLDVCARPKNAKAPRFYTKAENGLEQPWFGKVWCNPPYSNPKPWCRRAAGYAREPQAAPAFIHAVLLLPSVTDTGWFHDWVLPYAQIFFLRGRVRFLGWEGTPIGMPKGGNIIAVYPPSAAHVED